MSAVRPTILVVDAYAPFREAMEYCLPVFELEPVVAADENAARRLAAAIRVDVVLLDIGWPALNGLRFCREISAGGTPLGSVPVVLLSEVMRPEIIEQSRQAGAAKVLRKPFLWPDLLEAVAAAMAPRSLLATPVLPIAWSTDSPQT